MGPHAPHVLILSTADLDRPLWTNKQHLAVNLAPHVRVTYVDSLGLRRPQPTRADLQRVLRRLRPVAPDRSRLRQRHGIELVSPRLIPYHRGGPVEAINRRLLQRQVAAWLATPRDRRVLWSFSPVTYGLHEHAGAAVYHAVDLLGALWGVDAAAVARGERTLARAGIPAVASSRPIAEHLSAVGFADVRVWENVADTGSFADAIGTVERVGNRVLFAGNLTGHKVDVELLRRLVTAIDDLELHLAGPVGEGGAGDLPELAWFEGHPRVVVHGTLTPDELATLAASVAVGLVPYRSTPYTRGVFPMKVYEYLAAGAAVVSTPLPSLAGNPDVVLAADGETFVDAVRQHLYPAPDAVAARTAAAAGHSWQSRADQVLALIDELRRRGA